MNDKINRAEVFAQAFAEGGDLGIVGYVAGIERAFARQGFNKVFDPALELFVLISKGQLGTGFAHTL